MICQSKRFPQAFWELRFHKGCGNAGTISPSHKGCGYIGWLSEPPNTRIKGVPIKFIKTSAQFPWNRRLQELIWPLVSRTLILPV